MQIEFLAFLTVLGCCAQPAGAEGPLAVAGPPAEHLAPEIAGALGPEGLSVSLDGEPTWELWLARELPPPEDGDAVLGQELASLPEGGLVGAVRILRAWTDYKGTEIPPGAYTLRYLVAPEDGAHLGTALYRDFLLLVPADADGGAGEIYGPDRLVDLSRRATGTHHPAVVALFPAWSVDGGEGTPPALGVNELDQPTVLVAVGEVRFGLVIEGRGES